MESLAHNLLTELTTAVTSGGFFWPAGPTYQNVHVPIQVIINSANSAIDIALVCETSATGLQLGFKHGLTKINTYAKMSIYPLELT